MKVLIVDDSPVMASVIRGIVARLGDLETTVLHDPVAALAACRDTGFDLVLADYMMPGLDGIALVAAIRAMPGYAQVPIVMVTSADERGTCIAALEAGANDFVTKPLEPVELRARLSNLVALRRAQVALAQRADALSRRADHFSRVSGARESEILARFGRAVALRAGASAEAEALISDVCRIVARELGLDPATAAAIAMAATLRDIGKVGVPDRVLRKPGVLTEEEARLSRSHVEIGAELLDDSSSPMIRLARSIVCSHHERWDGSGYPAGLSGAGIPIEGRIVAIADTFAALCSDRDHRPAVPPAQARDVVLGCRGTRFDPACVDAFERGWHEVSGCLEAPPAERGLC